MHSLRRREDAEQHDGLRGGRGGIQQPGWVTKPATDWWDERGLCVWQCVDVGASICVGVWVSVWVLNVWVYTCELGKVKEPRLCHFRDTETSVSPSAFWCATSWERQKWTKETCKLFQLWLHIWVVYSAQILMFHMLREWKQQVDLLHSTFTWLSCFAPPKLCISPSICSTFFLFFCWFSASFLFLFKMSCFDQSMDEFNIHIMGFRCSQNQNQRSSL